MQQLTNNAEKTTPNNQKKIKMPGVYVTPTLTPNMSREYRNAIFQEKIPSDLTRWIDV